VPEPSHGKRRRGSQQHSRSAQRAAAARQPVRGGTVSSGIPGLPLLAGGLILLVVLVGGFLLLRPGGLGGTGSAASPSASSRPSAAVVGNGSCPTSQPPALPAGQTRTVTLNTPKGVMTLKIEADLSPIAAGNFVALAGCGFYDGTVFHRTPTLEDGTPFVIQGGDPTGTGTGGPGYTIKDETVTKPYKRGTVAMARSSAPDSVGSQFFIVLDDKDGAVLSSANTYQIIGNVTSGMETADAIFVASGGVELPKNPVPITTATVANP
jgi:cyclophilin family peptidyl-prolyl cis-trans isomerase